MAILTENLQEADSRHVTALVSVYDVRKGNNVLIKDGEEIRSKLVKAVKLPNTVVLSDPDGSDEETITLNPKSPQRDSSGQFKYWISEGKSRMSRSQAFGECDDMGVADTDIDLDMEDEDFDDEIDDEDFDDEFDDEEYYEDPEDFDDGEDFEDDVVPVGEKKQFSHDLKSFLREGEVGADVPAPDTSHSDDDGEDPEDAPPPHDTTGLENGGSVDTLAGERSSNTSGSAPADNTTTNGVASGPASQAGNASNGREHDPGSPDKSGGGVTEAIARDTDTALSLVMRGADPEMLTSRLLRGE